MATIVVGISMTLAITGCTTTSPMAFKLTSDGQVIVAFCDARAEIDHIEITVEKAEWPWIQQSREAQFVAESLNPVVITGGTSFNVSRPEGFLTDGTVTFDEGWTGITVVASGPDVNSLGHAGLIWRDQIVMDEWVWNKPEMQGAMVHCPAIDGIEAPRG